MNYKNAKIAVIFFVFMVANFLFASVCSRVYDYYEILFSPGQEFFYLTLWIFGSIIFVIVAAGLLAVLVRPFSLVFAAFALSALLLIFLSKTEFIISLFLGTAYLFFGFLFSRSVVKELDNRLNFSASAVKKGQGLLMMALIMLISLNFGFGYRNDAKERDFVIPSEIKQSVLKTVFSLIEAGDKNGEEYNPFFLFITVPEIKTQIEIGPEEKAFIISQAKQEIERGIEDGIEKSIKPYAEYIWLIPVFTASGILGFFQIFFSWVSLFIINIILFFLKSLGIVKVVTEMKEKKSLVLDRVKV